MVVPRKAQILPGGSLEVAIAYRAGGLNPVALVERLLDEIARDGEANTFLFVAKERAMREAQAAADRIAQGRALGPLDGVPIAWKDNIDLAGAPTRAASMLLPDGAKTEDAACVANATGAGLINLGKLNMSELAYTGLGLNPHFGAPRNIHGPAHVPGGSSSGSAAAVAHGQVALSVGTDTGGSVRVPAAFNGVVGYKSSEGRISTQGVTPLSRTLDTVGVLARNVIDCVLGDMALRGAITSLVRRRKLEDVAILVPSNLDLAVCDAAVVENFDLSIDALARAGATIERRSVDTLDAAQALTDRYGTLTAAEAYYEFSALIDGPGRDLMDPNIVLRMLDGKAMPASSLLAIQRARAEMAPSLASSLGDRLLATPTSPLTAPCIAPLLAAGQDRFREVNLRALRFSAIGNVLGMCGVAMPSGVDAAGLPTSILFSAPGGQDERLLAAALAIESALKPNGIVARRPDPHPAGGCGPELGNSARKRSDPDLSQSPSNERV